jgi:simple sugar transport system permease protein/ribose transport system permease protein
MANQKLSKYPNNNIIKNLKELLANILLNYTVWILVVIISITAIVLMPIFGTRRNLFNIIIQMIPMGMPILGEALCIMTGFMDLSLESTYALAPIIGVLVIRWAPDFPGIVYIGIAMVMITGMVIGLINGFLSVKLRINPFLVTLCMMLILRGLCLFLIPQGIFNLPKAFVFLGSYKILNNTLPISILFLIMVVIVLHWMLRRKPLGRHLLAVGSNERAAYLAGIKTERIKITVFVMAAMLAALGGFIAAGRQNSVLSAMGAGNMVLFFAGAILGGVSLQGGVGSIIGILGGIFLLQITSNIITLSRINPFLIQVVHGSILLIAILMQSFRTKLIKFTI